MDDKKMHVIHIHKSTDYYGGLKDTLVFEAEHFAEGEFLPYLVEMTMSYLAEKITAGEYDGYEYNRDGYGIDEIAEMLDGDPNFVTFLGQSANNITYLGHETPIVSDLVDEEDMIFNKEDLEEIVFQWEEDD